MHETSRGLLARSSLVAMCCIFLAASRATLAADATPSPRELWAKPQEPFKIFGTTYYVGTRGLGAVLITSDEGHVLVDAALPQTASLLIDSIESLGFRVEDIKFIVNSHAHSDHAGGIAELQRLSGAVVAASASGAAALRRGAAGPEDPQFEYGDSFPAVSNVRSLRDGEMLHVGSIGVTAHYTPGHTTGAASWTWKSCEGDRCLNIVYADSLTAVSDDSFKFTGNERYPTVLEDFKKSLRKVEALPCDILIAPHPESANLWTRLERRTAGDKNALIDTTACRRYIEAARERLNKRIEQEQQAARKET